MAYPLQQVMQALTGLREAVGLPAEEFPVEAFVGMISDEVDAARAAGKSDDEIVEIIRQSSGIELDTATLQANYATPEDRGHWESEDSK